MSTTKTTADSSASKKSTSNSGKARSISVAGSSSKTTAKSTAQKETKTTSAKSSSSSTKSSGTKAASTTKSTSTASSAKAATTKSTSTKSSAPTMKDLKKTVKVTTQKKADGSTSLKVKADAEQIKKVASKVVASAKNSKGSGNTGLKIGLGCSIGVILLLLVFGAWFVFGKPTLEVSSSGVQIVQTEEPIINHIPEILRGEYSLDNKGTAQNTVVTPEKKSIEAVKSKTGTTGSFSGDTGYSENNPLHLGNPSDAVAKISNGTNYLMEKKQYTLSYNTDTLCPNWVAWHLDSKDFGDADRSNDFRADENLPSDWYWVKKADYQYNTYGFDRGHVCPSADRTATLEDNSMTFLMTNMVPQSPDNNRVIWMHFENYERELVGNGKEAYIIAGPYGTGGQGENGKMFDSIDVTTKSGDSLKMNVPAYTWKVLILLDKGKNDISRINENTTVIAINVPNKMGIAKDGDWEQYLTSIDEIEALTGYDFFELLPDDIEDALEEKVYHRPDKNKNTSK